MWTDPKYMLEITIGFIPGLDLDHEKKAELRMSHRYFVFLGVVFFWLFLFYFMLKQVDDLTMPYSDIRLKF